MHFVLYKAWVLKNSSLGPAVSVKFILGDAGVWVIDCIVGSQ